MGRRKRWCVWGWASANSIFVVCGQLPTSWSPTSWPGSGGGLDGARQWSITTQSSWGRGEAHAIVGSWRSRADSAAAGWTAWGEWSTWSGLSTRLAAGALAEVPLAEGWSLAVGLGGMRTHAPHRLLDAAPVIRWNLALPLGSARVALAWRAEPSGRGKFTAQRQSAQAFSVTVHREHPAGWSNGWLAWDGLGFRFAATAWQRWPPHRTRGWTPDALGLRVSSPPWGLSIGGMWRFSGESRPVVVWGGVDAWGGQTASQSW